MDITPDLPTDGSTTVSGDDVVGIWTSGEPPASPGEIAVWISSRSLAEESPRRALSIAYARVTEINNTAIQGSSQRALIALMRATPGNRVMASPLQLGCSQH
jgi:hypothetical protein